jgi:hypothetical protein
MPTSKAPQMASLTALNKVVEPSRGEERRQEHKRTVSKGERPLTREVHEGRFRVFSNRISGNAKPFPLTRDRGSLRRQRNRGAVQIHRCQPSLDESPAAVEADLFCFTGRISGSLFCGRQKPGRKEIQICTSRRKASSPGNHVFMRLPSRFAKIGKDVKTSFSQLQIGSSTN